ncbi:hypothetical protein V8G54_016123 [Vigna mungo]|uniref:Uncharacterized protein n=1 Tax=Vigna mungo TaxID=3915 RepID=A0AAQ3NMB8_VIGMU
MMTCAMDNVSEDLIAFIMDRYQYCNHSSKHKPPFTMKLQHAFSIDYLVQSAIIQNFAVFPPMQSNRNLLGNPMQNSNRNITAVSTSTDFPLQNTMSVTPTLMDNINLSSPMIKMLHQKRKYTSTINGFKVAKKPCGRPFGDHRFTNSVFGTLPISSQCDRHLPLPSQIS